VGLFVGEGLRRGEGAVVVATQAHWTTFQAEIRDRGLDPDDLRDKGRLVVRDAHEALDRILKDGMPDAVRFREFAVPLLAGLSLRNGAETRAYGEMVSLLWKDGRYEAALRLEKLWNELGRAHRFVLLCAYEAHVFAPHAHEALADEVLHEHSHLLPPGEYERMTAAVEQAMDEIFGVSRAASLRPMITATHAQIVVMPGAQATLLWLRSHLPQRVKDVVAAARRKLGVEPVAAESGPRE
jgi:hypothetical protein